MKGRCPRPLDDGDVVAVAGVRAFYRVELGSASPYFRKNNQQQPAYADPVPAGRKCPETPKARRKAGLFGVPDDEP